MALCCKKIEVFILVIFLCLFSRFKLNITNVVVVSKRSVSILTFLKLLYFQITPKRINFLVKGARKSLLLKHKILFSYVFQKLIIIIGEAKRIRLITPIVSINR